jgi:hypothetical protein
VKVLTVASDVVVLGDAEERFEWRAGTSAAGSGQKLLLVLGDVATNSHSFSSTVSVGLTFAFSGAPRGAALALPQQAA